MFCLPVYLSTSCPILGCSAVVLESFFSKLSDLAAKWIEITSCFCSRCLWYISNLNWLISKISWIKQKNSSTKEHWKIRWFVQMHPEMLSFWRTFGRKRLCRLGLSFHQHETWKIYTARPNLDFIFKSCFLETVTSLPLCIAPLLLHFWQKKLKSTVPYNNVVK